MWSFLALGFLFVTVKGHNNKLNNDADLQTALMPQELNPEFVPGKDEPWKAVMPFIRARRELGEGDIFTSLQNCARVAAGVMLALAAALEFTLYVLDTWFN